MSVVLICVKYSQSLSSVLKAARRFCLATKSSAHIMHVLQPETTVFLGAPGSPVHFYGRPNLPLELQRLQVTCGKYLDSDLDVRYKVAVGRAIPLILNEADTIDSSYILAGCSQRSSFSKAFKCGILDELLRRSQRPVVVVPASLLK